MKVGIIGLPKVGKTTVFNALTGAGAAEFFKGDSKLNLAQVKVPDPRLSRLGLIYAPKQVVSAEIEFIDIALPKGTWLEDPEVISHFRQVDALLEVIRLFPDQTISPPEGGINPARDIRKIDDELALADLAIIERRITALNHQKGKKKSAQDEIEEQLLKRCQEALDAEQPIKMMNLNDEEEKLTRGFQFLTAKSLIIAANIAEEALNLTDYPLLNDLRTYTGGKGYPLIVLGGKIEAEVRELPEEERTEFLKALGIKEPAIDNLIRTVYSALGLISFFTIGKKEVKAWTVRTGTPAVKAAGKIHSDMERGFIRAEVISYEDLISCGSKATAKSKGLLRLEGKEYQIRDGDVVEFRFNV
ncbi:MAG: redox-regulated ATPase YchF [bacterium]